jgi:hypothetical protein
MGRPSAANIRRGNRTLVDTANYLSADRHHDGWIGSRDDRQKILPAATFSL